MTIVKETKLSSLDSDDIQNIVEHNITSDKREEHIEMIETELSQEDVNNTISNINTAIMQLELLKQSIVVTEQVHKSAIKNANKE